jgi:3-hydroxyisobutyrate dehydrogenase
MKTGFIGLGKMGSVMAPRLANLASELRGFDLNWQLPADSPVQPAPSVEALADCEIIFTMVPDGRVVVKIIQTLLDAGTEALFVDMSSCHPDTSGQLASLLAKTGQRVLDAPVSGGVAKARTGELMIMTGGDAADFERAAPFLATMGKPVHIGPAGAGYAMKALNNYVSAAGLVTSFQALATAKKFGIAPTDFQKVINASTGRNNTTEVKIDKFVLTSAYNSGFALNLMAKDVSIASDIMRQNGFSLPLTGDLAEYLKEACQQLGGDPDHTEIYRHLEGLANSRERP